jgi:hypothetical protein
MSARVAGPGDYEDKRGVRRLPRRYLIRFAGKPEVTQKKSPFGWEQPYSTVRVLDIIHAHCSHARSTAYDNCTLYKIDASE